MDWSETMSVIFVLMTASLFMALVFLGFFLWAARSGQFEDTETPAMRMLTDEEKTAKKQKEKEDKPT